MAAGVQLFSARARKQAKAPREKTPVVAQAAPQIDDDPDEVEIVREAAPDSGLGASGQDSEEWPTFVELGLSEWLAGNCAEMGIKRPSAVQRNCIPPILAGKDVLGTAETGSGKTAAFALPIIQALAQDPYGIFCLVLTPTRELAMQIMDQFRALSAGMTLKELVIIGGEDQLVQAKHLCKRPHVVVATPGRLQAHMQNDAAVVKAFAKLRFLVLDEADRLLDRAFEDELRVLLSSLPSSRQTLLFSATLTSSLQHLQRLSMRHAFQYLAYDGLRTVQSAQLQQQYVFMPQKVKEVYLAHTLNLMREPEWGVRSVVLFVGTCQACQTLSLVLAELGLPHSALHAALSQLQRGAALDAFRSGRSPVLVATDVAARGLDIPTVDLVINYDLPRVAKDYVHRVGRTARAGRRGRSLAFVTQYDIHQLQRIEAMLGRKLDDLVLDERTVLKGMTTVFKAKRVAVMKMAEAGGFDEKLAERQKLKKERREEKRAERAATGEAAEGRAKGGEGGEGEGRGGKKAKPSGEDVRMLAAAFPDAVKPKERSERGKKKKKKPREAGMAVGGKAKGKR